jgi:hypothetical protein
MDKTFDQQVSKEMYTPEEFQKVYDIVSEFYDGDDIEDFICSTDVETKDDFITDNEIENLCVCFTCGKFITEGYLYNECETYCSDKCFINAHGKSVFDNVDEDELFWTAWEG